MSYKPYTGVGSRETPTVVLQLMQDIAAELDRRGYTLRSGGAKGADKAFESGARTKEIYYANHCTVESMDIAKHFHPAWANCSEYARKLHGRNSFQVLGSRLNSPSQFLLCWTPDGCITHASRSSRTGGTGTAISIADYFAVPIFNLQRADHRARLEAMVNERKATKNPAFRGPRAYLSNMFMGAPIIVEGKMWPSVEHAFQAAKSADPDYQERVRNMTSPYEAKKAGRQCVMRMHWNKVKQGIMHRLVKAKFTQHPELLAKLKTEQELVEYNTWHDNFWGDCTCAACKNKPGLNTLGLILEDIRSNY